MRDEGKRLVPVPEAMGVLGRIGRTKFYELAPSSPSSHWRATWIGLSWMPTGVPPPGRRLLLTAVERCSNDNQPGRQRP